MPVSKVFKEEEMQHHLTCLNYLKKITAVNDCFTSDEHVAQFTSTLLLKALKNSLEQLIIWQSYTQLNNLSRLVQLQELVMYKNYLSSRHDSDKQDMLECHAFIMKQVIELVKNESSKILYITTDVDEVDKEDTWFKKLKQAITRDIIVIIVEER